MVNLLMPDLRSRSSRALWSRIGMLWAYCTLALTVIGLLALLPAYEATQIAEKQINNETTKKASERASALEKELGEAQVLLGVVNEYVRGTTIAPTIGKIRRIADIYASSIDITDLKVARTSDGFISASIVGATKSRETLIDFTKKLEADPAIQDVELPISDLAGHQGAYPFSINFKVQS